MHYNDPDIGAMDFLTAVMRDPSVSMADRVHAAQAITQVESCPLSGRSMMCSLLR